MGGGPTIRASLDPHLQPPACSGEIATRHRKVAGALWHEFDRFVPKSALYAISGISQGNVPVLHQSLLALRQAFDASNIGVQIYGARGYGVILTKRLDPGETLVVNSLVTDEQRERINPEVLPRIEPAMCEFRLSRKGRILIPSLSRGNLKMLIMLAENVDNPEAVTAEALYALTHDYGHPTLKTTRINRHMGTINKFLSGRALYVKKTDGAYKLVVLGN